LPSSSSEYFKQSLRKKSFKSEWPQSKGLASVNNIDVKGLKRHLFSKKSTHKNYILALDSILLADLTCLLKFTESFLVREASAFLIKISATLSFNVGMLLIAIAIYNLILTYAKIQKDLLK
jgi:hypothetical protein